MKKGSGALFFIYLLVGVYFINSALNLIPLPEFFTSINKWILLIGGVLIIIGGITLLNKNRFKY